MGELLWIIVRHLQPKSQILLVSNTYLAPDLFRRSMSSSFMQSATFFDWNNKTTFHQIQVCFDDFGKLLHKFLTKPSKALNNFRCYINIHSITSRHGKILEQAKFPAWAFRFQLSSFFTNALRCQWNRRLSFHFFVVSDWLYWVVEICQQDIPGGN